MIFNLKDCGGTFKGLIGECMFKSYSKSLVLTRFFNRNKYLQIFGQYLTESQVNFLSKNWYSLDAIDVISENGKKRLILYEVKTRNKYNKPLSFKPKMTLETHKLYHLASDLGFETRLATVWLCEKWDYTFEIQEFSEDFYCIDKPKKWDKKEGSTF